MASFTLRPNFASGVGHYSPWREALFVASSCGHRCVRRRTSLLSRERTDFMCRAELARTVRSGAAQCNDLLVCQRAQDALERPELAP